MKHKKVLGIIGIGPRGLYALENFITELHDLSNLQILLFEETGNFGNGQVYDLNQPTSNWMNVSERVLSLEARTPVQRNEINIPGFPSFHGWLKKDYEQLSAETADFYPPRAKIGAYLSERFETLIKPLLAENLVNLLPEKVEEVNLYPEGKLFIKTANKTYKNLDEVLLTIGHQPTSFDKQIKEWSHFVSYHSQLKLYKSPYPVEQYLKSPQLSENSKIGIRGFGLAMIDVIRAIAEKFGEFVTDDEFKQSCHYTTAYNIKGMLIPFSLDGLPPAPKPLNEKIDNWFKPSKKQLEVFNSEIRNSTTQKNATDITFLLKAFSPIAADIYHNLPNAIKAKNLTKKETESLIEKWLTNQDLQHPSILSQKQPALKTIENFIEMAIGNAAITLDYCIGQVWRFCQPSIYHSLSFNSCPINVFADIIALDESTKRYSYGPPVESLQQILALVKAEILILKMANNPEFDLREEGWLFKSKEGTLPANMMIDSVLSPPKIDAVNTSIVKKLLSNDLMVAVHDEYGVDTDENGYLKSANNDMFIPIALLGRLAKGTIIGVDAIAECFGERPKKWATEAAKRFSTY